MPSRNRSAKACEHASLSPNETAPCINFSGIVYASRNTWFLFLCFVLAPAPGEAGSIAQPGTRCPAPPAETLRHSCRGNGVPDAKRIRTAAETGLTAAAVTLFVRFFSDLGAHASSPNSDDGDTPARAHSGNRPPSALLRRLKRKKSRRCRRLEV